MDRDPACRALPTLLALLHGAVIWIWHTPKLYVLALDNLWWHAFEHACFLFTGWLFWWSVLRANPKQVPQALMAVLLTLMHTGLLGALLTFGSVSFYGEGRSVEDQQLAGLIMWVPGADLPDRRRLDRLALADPHVAAAEYASRRAGSLTRNGGRQPCGKARSVEFLANPVQIGTGLGLLFDQIMAEEHAELGNVALGRGIGSDDLEHGPASQVAHLVVQHHHRLGTVQAGGVENGVDSHFS